MSNRTLKEARAQGFIEKAGKRSVGVFRIFWPVIRHRQICTSLVQTLGELSCNIEKYVLDNFVQDALLKILINSKRDSISLIKYYGVSKQVMYTKKL